MQSSRNFMKEQQGCHNGRGLGSKRFEARHHVDDTTQIMWVGANRVLASIRHAAASFCARPVQDISYMETSDKNVCIPEGPHAEATQQAMLGKRSGRGSG